MAAASPIQPLAQKFLYAEGAPQREKIKTRQAEGIATAKDKGVAFGRPKATKPENWDSVIGEYKQGLMTATKAMELLGLKRTTFYKLLNQ